MMFPITDKTKRLCIVLAIYVVTFLAVTTSHAQVGRGYYVTPPSWSPDGSRVALVIGNDIEVRDATSTELLYVLSGHTDFVPMVAWSPDGNMIATPSYDQTVKLWSTTDGTLLNTLSGHNEAVTAVAWSPDGTRLLSWGFDTRPNMFIWDAATGALLERHNSGSIVAAAFSPDGQRLALATPLSIGTIDAQTFEVLSGSPRVPCCPNTMYSIAWSPDGNTLVTGSINGLVTLWDAKTAQILSQFIANPYHQPDSRDVDNLALSWVRDVTFAPDGSTVLSVSGDGAVREWEVATGTLVQDTQISPLATAAWSPYGVRLAVVDLITRSGATLNDEQAFDASNLAGNLNMIVPFATSEQLETLAEVCGVPTATIQTLVQLTQETDMEAVENTLEGLSDLIPAACEADLRALSEVIQSR